MSVSKRDFRIVGGVPAGSRGASAAAPAAMSPDRWTANQVALAVQRQRAPRHGGCPDGADRKSLADPESWWRLLMAWMALFASAIVAFAWIRIRRQRKASGGTAR